ncbi:MAG TPA: hypothetical protein VK735_24720 [Pseudonocardia sp.]|uniref:hypothetical protein n=1 Tax=Pseudonocardia sp. TaxID=60912 RepID=UPI002B642BA3|nr:hypothetical protein [Pseudonocardia sp.]HTF50657.1 hypothetical protein [Pseudonocardia sp.]
MSSLECSEPRADAESVRSRRRAAEVGQVMAHFTFWLAHQPVPDAQRRRYERCAEQFLRWQAAGPDRHADRSVARYLLQLRRDEASAAEQASVRATIALLQRYRILTTRQDWTRPGS